MLEQVASRRVPCDAVAVRRPFDRSWPWLVAAVAAISAPGCNRRPALASADSSGAVETREASSGAESTAPVTADGGTTEMRYDPNEAEAPIDASLSQTQALGLGRDAAEKALTRAYTSWAKQNTTDAWSPPAGEGQWIADRAFRACSVNACARLMGLPDGWRLTASLHPPAGFEFDKLCVHIDRSGSVRVEHAEAQFSPE